MSWFEWSLKVTLIFQIAVLKWDWNTTCIGFVLTPYVHYTINSHGITCCVKILRKFPVFVCQQALTYIDKYRNHAWSYPMSLSLRRDFKISFAVECVIKIRRKLRVIVRYFRELLEFIDFEKLVTLSELHSQFLNTAYTTRYTGLCFFK